MKKIFITGTDTDAGKTLVTRCLLHKAKSLGLSCFGLKPVAAGCDWHEASQSWHNDDALFLQQASEPSRDYCVHNPIALPLAIAPHIAAIKHDYSLTLEQLMSVCEPGLEQAVDVHIVEGAGGWLVPLNDDETLADFASLLAQQKGYDVVLVVGMKLGCINHALLTQQLITSMGLTLAGWVANHIDPDMSEADANFDYLASHLKAPCLGRIPFCPQADPKNLVHHIELPH